MCTEIIHSLQFFPVFPLTLNLDSGHFKFLKLAETKLTFKFIWSLLRIHILWELKGLDHQMDMAFLKCMVRSWPKFRHWKKHISCCRCQHKLAYNVIGAIKWNWLPVRFCYCIRIRIRIFIFHNSPYSDILTTASTILYQNISGFYGCTHKVHIHCTPWWAFVRPQRVGWPKCIAGFRLWQEGKGGRIKPEALIYSESPCGSGSKFSINKGIRFC